MRYLTQEAKKAIVEKALNRKNKTLSEIANEHNIGHSTLDVWLQKYREGKLNISTNVSSSSNTQLTRSEQFKHLLATSGLDDTELGVYCRERGLYSFQLQQWKNEFMSHDNNQKKQETQSELKILRTENKLLKQDLYRKDRALAETTALLILKKKADLLFGGFEDV
jgi:transposase-like protein